MKKKDNESYLNYIKINRYNKLEDFGEERENQLLMDLVNSISVEKEDNIGKEINKFFIKILPENKDADILKANYALSKKIRESSELNKNQLKKQYEEYMTELMNLNINQKFILTREINEKLSFILAGIFKKIQKINKFNKHEELIQNIIDISKTTEGIFEKYKDKKKNEISASKYIYDDNKNEDIDNLSKSNNILFSSNASSSSRISRVINYNNNNVFTKSLYYDYNNNINATYKFKELKTKKPINIPLEVLILREKFEKIKKLKFILKSSNNMHNNDISLLEQKDIFNNIFILLNLKWLFPFLIEIELDLTNEKILKEEILSINDIYDKFLKKAKRNKKSTNYQSEYKNRVFDTYKNTMFNENKQNVLDDFEVVSESLSMISSVKDTKDEEIKRQEQFLIKYKASLEMIIIYWYFISKIENIRTCNITIPINLEDKILLMLKEKNILIFDFHILSNLSSDKIIEVTLDFNSLDNKLFEQVLNFLFKNDKMKNCRISFFPSEEYFEPQFLFNLLFNHNNKKISQYIKEIKTNEEIELFLLRKLSEYFENNINKFFIFFINKRTLKEISLIFDMPNILNKIDYYELIIMKLILNMFIFLDKTINNNINFALDTFTIIAENLYLDNRKHPFLNHFFDSLIIYKKKNLLLQKLTLKLKIFGVTNIYKIIPYHINYLSIGSFDLESFEYFVEYITSVQFNFHSEIKSLQISLSNTIISIDKCYDLLLRLLVEHPKNLEEISIYTSLYADYSSIKTLLESTNYNKIEKIFIQFNRKSLEDKKLREKYGNKLQNLENNRDNNFMDLYFVKTIEKNKDKILRAMYKIGNKYNRKFMDYNIFLELEKFINSKEKKMNIIQYK